DRYHKNGTIFPFKKKKEKQTNQKNKEIKNMISGTDSISSGSCHVQKYHGFVFLVFNTLQQKNEEPLLFTLLGKKVIINNNVNIDSYSDRMSCQRH
ncbi:hypothetical protein DKP78_17990, partial [Enterococcus faecium]